MSTIQDVVNDVASRIRKIEDLITMQQKANRMIEHETKCLHKALAEGMKLANVSIDEGGAVVFGGGTPKDNDDAAKP